MRILAAILVAAWFSIGAYGASTRGRKSETYLTVFFIAAAAGATLIIIMAILFA